MDEYKETATLEEKKLAMKLAYKIVTDKRNTNRYLGTFIAKENKDGLFRYHDMLRGMRVIFNEIENRKD